MIIKQEWTMTCRFCKEKTIIREYDGLPGSRMGDHFCKEKEHRIDATNAMIAEGDDFNFFEEPIP